MKEAISAESWLPDVITNYPAVRAVFDRYGLQGCGGPGGPRETVGWFSRLHGVPVEQLLAELQAAASGPQPAPSRGTPSVADTIYRPFFLACIAVVFTLGCVWGAVNLFTIGSRHSFGGVNYSWILAHADAMVFGFVGFFVMGVRLPGLPALQARNAMAAQTRLLDAAAHGVGDLPPDDWASAGTGALVLGIRACGRPFGDCRGFGIRPRDRTNAARRETAGTL